MAHVDERERAKAVEIAGQLVNHQMDRVRDCLDRAHSLLDPSTRTNPDEALAEINRAANLAGRAQQVAQMWKGLVIDWQKSNPNFITTVPSSKTIAGGAITSGTAFPPIDVAG